MHAKRLFAAEARLASLVSVLTLLFAAAWPLLGHADTYPAIGRYEWQTPEPDTFSFGPNPSSPAARSAKYAETAQKAVGSNAFGWNAGTNGQPDWCPAGPGTGRIISRVIYPDPYFGEGVVRFDTVNACTGGQPTNNLWSSISGPGIGPWSCPSSGTPTLMGSPAAYWCANAPPCPAGQTRDFETGTCQPFLQEKMLGASCTIAKDKDIDLGIGNPCNAGTGTKFQIQPAYRSTASPLVEQLSYNSRLLADAARISRGAYGKGWRGNYERVISEYATWAVARRSDGKELTFRKPPSGNVYLSDADVADRLERLVNGSGATTGWKLVSAADESTETYGANGKLLSIADRAGATLTLTYSTASTPPSVAPQAGLLISVSDPWGRALNFIYDNQKRIVRMTDPANGNYIYSYGPADNLASITFPDTKVRQYRYNEQEHTQNTALPNSLTGIIDENGARFATFKYDSQGRAVSTEYSGGAQKYTLEYTTPGALTTVTDPQGVARGYGLTSLHGVLKGTGITGSACPGCGPASQSHDANGNVSSRTDWNGNRTNYSYDLTRNLETSRTEALTSGGATTPQTRTITTAWHATFRLPIQIAEPLRKTTNVYDQDGTQCGARGALCSRTVQATTDPNGSQGFAATASGNPRTWTYTYNAKGRPLTVDGPRTDVSDVTTYTYYGDADTDLGKRGNLATITNAAGHLTSITAYNAHGQPLTIVDPNGMMTTLAYDARQRPTSRNVGGEVTSYDYDNAGQVIKVTLPDGSFLAYEYDDAHRLIEISDNTGNRIVYTLDAMGNRTQEEVRDPANALAQKRSRVYNSLNQLFQELGAQNQTTEYTYDNQGNVLTVKDPLNHITTNQYDALNRLQQVTDPASGITQYAYNGLDALTQVTDPRSVTTAYTLNGLGDISAQVSPDTGTTTNTNDSAGNLLTQTDAKGQISTYAYDALNRVTSITFHDGSKHNYSYDGGTNGIGKLTGMTELNPAQTLIASIAYAYDPKGRMISDTRTINAVPYTTGYRYDSSGRLDRITYPSGRTVDYSFDSLGRVSGVTTTPTGGTASNVATDISYHPFGAVKSYTLGNGQTYVRGYDQDGRINSYTLGAAGYSIGYDAASRIEFITEVGSPTNSNTYGYDVLGRLTSANTPSTNYGYSFDAVGNRLSKTVGAGSDTYAYAATSNRIATITPSSGPVRSFTLDPNGSTTVDGINTYAYDVRGRMIQSVGSLGTTTYQVNALGQRVRKTDASNDTVFHYDVKGHLIAESTVVGAMLKEYVWLGDTPITVINPTGSYFVHVDHLNTPRGIFDDQQQLHWKWDQQEPFGVSPANENPSGLGIFKFGLRHSGQYDDSESGMFYNYLRDCYDPTTGRFCQPDLIGAVLFRAMAIRSLGSIGLVQSQLLDDLYSENPRYNHLYAYAFGNPLRFTDPTGLVPGDEKSSDELCGRAERVSCYKACSAIARAMGGPAGEAYEARCFARCYSTGGEIGGLDLPPPLRRP